MCWKPFVTINSIENPFSSCASNPRDNKPIRKCRWNKNTKCREKKMEMAKDGSYQMCMYIIYIKETRHNENYIFRNLMCSVTFIRFCDWIWSDFFFVFWWKTGDFCFFFHFPSFSLKQLFFSWCLVVNHLDICRLCWYVAPPNHKCKENENRKHKKRQRNTWWWFSHCLSIAFKCMWTSKNNVTIDAEQTQALWCSQYSCCFPLFFVVVLLACYPQTTCKPN